MYEEAVISVWVEEKKDFGMGSRLTFYHVFWNSPFLIPYTVTTFYIRKTKVKKPFLPSVGNTAPIGSCS